MTEVVRYLHETHAILNTDLSLWCWRVKHDPAAKYKYGDIILYDFSKAQILKDGFVEAKDQLFLDDPRSAPEQSSN